MDGAYFVGRKDLLDFFNNLLDLNLAKIEQTASGAVACQLTELIFPNSIPMQKVNWEARSDFEFVQNYKLLQAAFNKHRVQRHVDVDKLIRAKYQDNLEFCQWLKAFYDQSGVFREDYDPVAVRARGKGGKKYNQQMGKGGKAATRPRPAAASKPSAAGPVAITEKPELTAAERKNRPLRERPAANTEPEKKDQRAKEETQPTAEQVVADAQLLKQNADLTTQVAEFELTLLEIEKERDFYFEKLRNVEIMLQVYQETAGEGDPDHLIDNVFKILYATAEENLTVNDQGEVVVVEQEGEEEVAETV